MISNILSVLSFVAAATAQQCKLQFDGRVPADFVAADFDKSNGIFNPSFIFGQNLTLSKVALLDPCAGASLFGGNNTQPIDVTINDNSIFVPNANTVQRGFRRTELLIASNNGTDGSTVGIKTLHFSLKKDDSRQLNFSHEYQLAFLESADFSTNQVVLKTGTIIGGNGSDPNTLQLFGNVNEAQPGLIFSHPFDDGVFHNFAIKLDFNALTTQVFYSQASNQLAAVTGAIANNVTGQGQFHFGVLKKGIGGGSNIVTDAFQPSGINEGLFFDGIFEEDSSNGCISLKP
jgi:hypothetical protein